MKKLNIAEKLDFNDIDLTAPEKVVCEVLDQLSEETNGIVLGKIIPYSGHVVSYTKTGLSAVTLALGSVTDKEVNIQEDLGKIGQETKKFECFLYTPEYEKYKYRVFFIKYGIAHYPVDVILEESIAKSLSNNCSRYLFKCDTREALETLIINIFTSKKMISVMQELIRINQTKKDLKAKEESTFDSEE